MKDRLIASLYDYQPSADPCRALYVRTNPVELTEQWQMVAKEGTNYQLSVSHRNVPLAHYDAQYATLAAEYGADNVMDLGVTFDARPYYLGTKRLGGEDQEDIDLFVAQAYTRENYIQRLKNQQREGDNSLEMSQLIMLMRAVTDEQYEYLIQERREQAKADICALLTLKEAQDRANAFYLADPAQDQEKMQAFIQKMQRGQRHLDDLKFD